MPLVREGAFEVLFRDNRFNYNDKTNNVCWNAFDAWRKTPIPALTELLQLQTFATAIKRYMEAMSVFFDFYWRCDLESVNVEMGKRLSTWSGLVDLVIVGGFTYIDKIKSPAWIAGVTELVDHANLAGTD
jgi:hypothetical protein